MDIAVNRRGGQFQFGPQRDSPGDKSRGIFLLRNNLETQFNDRRGFVRNLSLSIRQSKIQPIDNIGLIAGGDIGLIAEHGQRVDGHDVEVAADPGDAEPVGGIVTAGITVGDKVPGTGTADDRAFNRAVDSGQVAGVAVHIAVGGAGDDHRTDGGFSHQEGENPEAVDASEGRAGGGDPAIQQLG